IALPRDERVQGGGERARDAERTDVPRDVRGERGGRQAQRIEGVREAPARVIADDDEGRGRVAAGDVERGRVVCAEEHTLASTPVGGGAPGECDGGGGLSGRCFGLEER